MDRVEMAPMPAMPPPAVPGPVLLVATMDVVAAGAGGSMVRAVAMTWSRTRQRARRMAELEGA